MNGTHDNRPSAAPPQPKAETGPKPTAGDFAPESVNRAVLLKALGNPATTYALVGAVLAAGWGLVFGWTETALLAMLGLGFLSVGAAVWNFFIRGDKLAAEHVNKLRALREQFKLTEAEEIEASCRQAGFDEGAKEAAELAAAYETLSQFLAQQTGDARALTAERYGLLAEDTYFQGVAILRKALALFSALKSIDVKTLEAEAAGWRKNSALSMNPEALQRKVAAHEKTIKLCHENEAKVQTALAECNGLEAELKSAHLELIDLFSGAENQPLPSSGAESRLQQAVAAARRVEDRLTQLSEPDTSADQAYLEAGQRTVSKS